MSVSRGTMVSDDSLQDVPLTSVDFEVFGKVQGKSLGGCYFTKYTRDLCRSLGIGGWVKNSKKGTILGKMQGPKPYVDQMAHWLTTVGSPGCEIHHTEFTNWETIRRPSYGAFQIRF
ncbi:acylphosphatase-2 isoform X1 [Fopius arisanus]|uniref:acylphosphatase n=1 Tax=Fopius arisanus TaxID=64838 RepID=A0A9R1U831_9HYME|nr:PREDICTED: acylphosphatase-2 isoform X1 [Fopius arisanus]XP_011310797.1 PREDICTED: acylphosphatase-2 isoform X1 [Fopius arisanus]